MKREACCIAILSVMLSQNVISQTLIPIPDTISGTAFMLTIKDSVTQFYPGINTSTIGYNGSYLGPTIILKQGDIVHPVVHNLLNDTTTNHWHGLHVPPMSDGGPHALILPGEMWMPHFKVMDKSATYWYHPHPHEKTMEQVVKGAAGLIIVRDDEEAALTLPRTYGVDDIPLIFQFQTFDTVTKQIIVNDELDNTVLVNGTINGMVNIPAQVVRLRLLNASSHRFFRFGFADNRPFYQITSDDGLLDVPVPLTRLDLASGERAEILVDLSADQGATLYLKTYASEFPTGYPGGPMTMGMPLGPLDNIDFNVLQINVTPSTTNPITTIPTTLTTNPVWSQTGASNRNIDFSAQPMMSMNFFINGVKFDMEVVNFSVQQENVEIWTINNQTFRAHPFHIHGNHFYVLDRNGMTPPPNERGRKDVVIVPAMGGVRIITKFSDFSDTSMAYMYHCHTLSHEDDGMMGQFRVLPVSPLTGSIVANVVSCFGGSDGSIDLSVSGGVTPYSFQWSNGDTTQNLSGLTAGGYSVTITDSFSSIVDYSVNVQQPLQLIITDSVKNTSCFGANDGSIDISVSGGAFPYSITWANGSNSFSVADLSAGSYGATITDNNGCNAFIDSVMVMQGPEFSIGSISGDVNPPDNSLSLYSVVDDSQSVYQWTVSTGQILSGQGTNEVQVQWSDGGQGEIMVTVANGPCSDTSILQIVISSLKEIDAFQSLIIFPNPNNGSFTLQFDAATDQEIQVSVSNILGQKIYESKPENITGEYSNSLSLINLQEGIYFVKVKIEDVYIVRKIILSN